MSGKFRPEQPLAPLERVLGGGTLCTNSGVPTHGCSWGAGDAALKAAAIQPCSSHVQKERKKNNTFMLKKKKENIFLGEKLERFPAIPLQSSPKPNRVFFSFHLQPAQGFCDTQEFLLFPKSHLLSLFPPRPCL